MKLKIIHISDLHFTTFSWNPSQFFSKRFIGNMHFAFLRRNEFEHNHINPFLDYIDEVKPSHILVSGDFTTTSLKKEYLVAAKFIQTLKNRGIKLYAIPGNHDAYTKKAYKKKVFYQTFRSLIPFKGEFDFDLEHHRVAAFKLTPARYLVLIDAARYTSFFQSNGVFSFEIEQHLQSLLDTIPKDAKIWLMCHFPFFEHEHPKRTLLGAKNLKKVIERFERVELFIHGHTHRQAVVDLSPNGLPMISDSGSITLKKKSTFNLIESDSNSISITPMHFQDIYRPVLQHGVKKQQ